MSNPAATSEASLASLSAKYFSEKINKCGLFSPFSLILGA
jgi:hypothetical protein